MPGLTVVKRAIPQTVKSWEPVRAMTRSRSPIRMSDRQLSVRVHQGHVVGREVSHRGPHAGQRGDAGGGPHRKGWYGAGGDPVRCPSAVPRAPDREVGSAGGEETLERGCGGAREDERTDDERHGQHDGSQGARHPSLVGEDAPYGDPQQNHAVPIESLVMCLRRRRTPTGPLSASLRAPGPARRHRPRRSLRRHRGSPDGTRRRRGRCPGRW